MAGAEERGPGAPRRGGAGTFTTALVQSLARYRYVIGLASAILLVLALLPTRGPDQAAAGKPRGGSGFTVIDPTAPKKPGSRPGRAAPPVETTVGFSGAATAPAAGSAEARKVVSRVRARPGRPASSMWATACSRCS